LADAEIHAGVAEFEMDDGEQIVPPLLWLRKLADLGVMDQNLVNRPRRWQKSQGAAKDKDPLARIAVHGVAPGFAPRRTPGTLPFPLLFSRRNIHDLML